MITVRIEDQVTGECYMNITDFTTNKFPLPRIGEQISILIEEPVEDDNQRRGEEVLRFFMVNNAVHHYRSMFEIHNCVILLEVTQIDKDYTNEIISNTI